MKAILVVFGVCFSMLSQAQTNRDNRSEIKRPQGTTTPTNTTVVKPGNNPATSTNRTNSRTPTTSNNQKVQPRQSITEKRVNGASTNNSNSNSTPFVGGIHAGANAGQKFTPIDSSAALRPVDAVTVAGGNDTTFNVNSLNQNGVNTTSGAVDRSGQSQFGQTNWGRNERNTIGESQWTVPPPITATFNKEFPAVNAEWSRSVSDTTTFAARYKMGAQWVTSTYNSAGQRLEMRTEIPMLQAPRPVSVFLAKQPQGFQVTSLSKLQLQGRADVYEVRSSVGKTYYVNNDGMEVKF